MKRKFEYWKSIGLILVFLTLGGCGATSQPSKFYLLNSLSSSEKLVSNLPSGMAIGIGPIHIPEYVDRPQKIGRAHV
jgi:uncharacterized lipoprotein YmbA